MLILKRRISKLAAKIVLLRPLAKTEERSVEKTESKQEAETRGQKRRKREIVGSGVGVIGGAVLGAQIGTGIGIATAGWGMAATVPLSIAGGAIFGLVGNRVGLALDQRKDDKDNES